MSVVKQKKPPRPITDSQTPLKIEFENEEERLQVKPAAKSAFEIQPIPSPIPDYDSMTLEEIKLIAKKIRKKKGLTKKLLVDKPYEGGNF